MDAWGNSEIVMMDATALASAIASRRLSCAEAMAAFLDQVERLNPAVNALVALQDRGGLLAQAQARDDELARGESRGPLHGLPLAPKDLQAVKGIVGSSRVDLQACKLEYSIVSPK